MKTTLLSIATSSLLLLSGCQTGNLESSDEISKNISSKAVSVETIDSPTNVLRSINAAADWQLARMDDFESYIPSFIHRTIEPRGWVQGAFYIGLAEWAKTTDNQEYFNFLIQHGKQQQWKLGDRRYHADDHVIAQYYLYAYENTQNPKFLEPLISEFDAILASKPDTPLDFNPKGKISDQGYDHDCQKRWCWSDALFMSPPAWFHLSKITGDDKYAAYAFSEFKIVTDYLLDKEYDLYFRDSRFFDRREENGKKIFWSRGNGWVYSGLTRIINTLSADDPRREYYVDLFQDMSKSLKNLQADNGYWPVSLAAGELYQVPESSGTAFFISGLAWGVNNGILNKNDYIDTIDKGWKALLKAQKVDGMIGSVQQVGYAPDKVSPDETQLYGAGAFLLAGTEILKLVRQNQ